MTQCVRPRIPGDTGGVSSGRAEPSERFGLTLWIARSGCGGRFGKSGSNANGSPCFGIVQYDRPAGPAGRAARPMGGSELAVRFGVSQSLRSPTSTRSLAMILMNGLKALANPTRLRVLELLKNPAAFDGPRDD